MPRRSLLQLAGFGLLLIAACASGAMAERTLVAHYAMDEGTGRTVWTFYNANPHSVQGRVLSLPADPDVTYYDAYYDRPVTPVVKGNRHLVGPVIWPHDIGCLVREKKK